MWPIYKQNGGNSHILDRKLPATFGRTLQLFHVEQSYGRTAALIRRAFPLSRNLVQSPIGLAGRP
jgi:hypothetical protein